MALISADHRIDLQKLEKITAEPASMQTEKEPGPLFPDCAVGTIPPFGNLYDLSILMPLANLAGETLQNCPISP